MNFFEYYGIVLEGVMPVGTFIYELIKYQFI